MREVEGKTERVKDRERERERERENKEEKERGRERHHSFTKDECKYLKFNGIKPV